MFITGLGTASPARRYLQLECWEVFRHSELSRQLSSRSCAIIRKVLTGNNGVVSRHLSLDRLEEAFALGPDDLHARFAKHAPALASAAGARAMESAALRPEEVDAVIVSTCTGYLCPGLTSHVSERLGLRGDVLTLDLVGQGCGAALPNLRAGEALLASGNCQNVLSVCVEVCSAALYFDDDPGVLISACLFGDGAGAAVLSRAANENGGRKVRWRASGSLLKPEERDRLRFEQKAGCLRNILRPEVPALAGSCAPQVLEQVLARAGVARREVTGWIMHSGGRDVLMALREGLGLSAHDLRWSEAVLREHGNVSSACVYFVLQAALADSVPGGYWWLSSFGAGFSCHGALLWVE
jgi:alkylresorcinol/alkylpyrone synthase